MKQHYHSWRRFNETTWLCHEPTCFKKSRLDLIDGKLCKCPFCSDHFVASGRLVKPEDTLITCPLCAGIDPGFLTLEMIHSRMENVAHNTFKPLVDKTQKLYETKLRELDARESKLNVLQGELALWEAKLENREASFKRKYRVALEKIKLEKLKIKEMKFKTQPTKAKDEETERLGNSIEEILRRELMK